jgi:predicted nucleic acid-binding protein
MAPGDRLLAAPITPHAPPELHREAWRVAEALGWAKTYDAEYIALARVLGCRLLTVDKRLQRGAGRLDTIVGPADL